MSKVSMSEVFKNVERFVEHFSITLSIQNYSTFGNLILFVEFTPVTVCEQFTHNLRVAGSAPEAHEPKAQSPAGPTNSGYR
jgi:hypothetical protein